MTVSIKILIALLVGLMCSKAFAAGHPGGAYDFTNLYIFAALLLLWIGSIFVGGIRLIALRSEKRHTDKNDQNAIDLIQKKIEWWRFILWGSLLSVILFFGACWVYLSY